MNNLMDNLLNSESRGEYSVSLATVYFLSNGYQVLSPYGNRGKYDLVIEKNNIFQSVQCKWTSHMKKPNNYPRVPLRVCGSAKKDKGGIAQTVVYYYTLIDFDFLWVSTPFACYLIPSKDIFNNKKSKKSILTLYPKWDIYRVSIPIPKHTDNNENIRVSPRLTNEDKILIRRLLKSGKTQQEIADILSVTRGCISVFLYRNKK